jgi:integrase
MGSRPGSTRGHQGRARHAEGVRGGDEQPPIPKRSKLPRIRLHDLRHTHATSALRAGIHPKVVSERLGHATISITPNTYSHAIPAMQEEAAVRIAELVFA